MLLGKITLLKERSISACLNQKPHELDQKCDVCTSHECNQGESSFTGFFRGYNTISTVHSLPICHYPKLYFPRTDPLHRPQGEMTVLFYIIESIFSIYVFPL